MKTPLNRLSTMHVGESQVLLKEMTICFRVEKNRMQKVESCNWFSLELIQNDLERIIFIT